MPVDFSPYHQAILQHQLAVLQSDNYIPHDSIVSNRSGLSPTRLPPTSDASCKYTMLPALLMKLLKSFPPMPFLLLLLLLLQSHFSCVRLCATP